MAWQSESSSCECDLLSGVDAAAAFDFIVSNPPYVSEAEYENLPRDVKCFEPREALLAGPREPK